MLVGGGSLLLVLVGGSSLLLMLRSFLNQGVQIFNKKSLHISSRIMGVDREVLAAGKAGLNLFKKFND